MWGMHGGANPVPQLLDLAWTLTSILRGSGRQMRAGPQATFGAIYSPSSQHFHKLRCFRGDGLVGFPPPVAETSTSPDREHHADLAVIFAFSSYARIARHVQSIGRDFAWRGSATGFFHRPLTLPRDVSSTGQVIRDIGNICPADEIGNVGASNRAPFCLRSRYKIPKFSVLYTDLS
jgi:hypothetical protein